MKKNLVALAVAGAVSAPLFAAADAAPVHTFTGNVGIVTDYVFRGVSQSHTHPAIQGGFDYAHSSGLYAGIWGSSISWVSDGLGGSYPVELDVYGGYKGSITDDFGYDVGLITYNYPGDGRAAGSVNPNTTEVYGALSWKWLTLKYSHVVSSHFVGWTTLTGGNTRNSNYLELNANYDLGDGWGIAGHIGHQKVKGNGPASYTDWKIGVTKDFGFGVVGLSYSDTNTSGTCNGTLGGTNAYCWGNNSNTANFKDVSKGVAVLSFTKSF